MMIAYRSMHGHPQRFLSCARLPVARIHPALSTSFPLTQFTNNTFSQNHTGTLQFVFVPLYSIMLMYSTICTLPPRTSQTSFPLFGIYICVTQVPYLRQLIHSFGYICITHVVNANVYLNREQIRRYS